MKPVYLKINIENPAHRKINEREYWREFLSSNIKLYCDSIFFFGTHSIRNRRKDHTEYNRNCPLHIISSQSSGNIIFVTELCWGKELLVKGSSPGQVPRHELFQFLMKKASRCMFLKLLRGSSHTIIKEKSFWKDSNTRLLEWGQGFST